MANAKEKKEHLPFMGVGPIYVMGIILLTITGIALKAAQVIKTGTFDVLKTPFLIVGILLILYGVILWAMANFHSQIDKRIASNTLTMTGIYGIVRNPIYSGGYVCLHRRSVHC